MSQPLPEPTVMELQRRINTRREMEAQVTTSAFECPFCIIAATRPGDSEIMLVAPLDPVTPGHMLVIPRKHFADATVDPNLAAQAFYVAAACLRDSAAGLVKGPANLITSIGPEATQTVPHFHLHVVPRAYGDGLHLPWTGQKADTPPPSG